MAERDYTIDILKGIGIMLVILGHCLEWENPVTRLIYSFHMPLFFLVSGYFFQKYKIKDQIKKDYNRLIVPYLWVSAIIAFVFIGYTSHDPSFPLLDKIVIPLLWGAGGPHQQVLVFNQIGAITQMWFLLALFWGRLVLNLLPNGLGGVFSAILLSVIATVIGRYVIFLPWDINEGVSAIVFLMIGRNLKTMGTNRLFTFICIVLWITSLFYFNLSMGNCCYDCYPIQVLGATGGTIAIYYLSKMLLKIGLLNTAFIWLGMNSMAILCVHTLETHTGLWKMVGINQQSIMVFPVKVAICCIVVYMLGKWSYTKKILGIKTYLNNI